MDQFKRAVYIYYTGYGPCSDFTLAEWFEARDFVNDNKSKLKVLNGN